MVSEPPRIQPRPPSLKLIKMHVTFDLSEIEEVTLHGRARENLSLPHCMTVHVQVLQMST